MMKGWDKRGNDRENIERQFSVKWSIIDQNFDILLLESSVTLRQSVV
jgi:hypothetical protein